METESTAQGQFGGEIACGLYSIECRGIDPCISAAHSSTACLSSTLDEAMAASSTTTACLFGLEQVDEEAARGTHTQHQAMADDDGDLAVPELGKWVEALIQDLEVRLGPDDSAAYQMLTSTQSSMRLLTKGASRASFAVRRATGRTTCSDSSKMTVRDCATSGSKDINSSLARPSEGDSRARALHLAMARRCGGPCPHPGARRHREGSRAPARFSGGDVSENGTSTQRARGPPARLVGLRPVEAHLRRKHRAGRRKAARPRRALACRVRGDRGERWRRRRLSPRKGTRCCGLSTRGSAL